MAKKFVFLFVLLIFGSSSFCQDTLPKGYFRAPLGISMYLAGNFGELRSNHFHSGIDIKTQGKEGFRVYASADGYVSRVKISPWGYGKVVYIDHPNGYTTVYAHLQQFKGKIAEEIKKYQYQIESWEIDWYPPDTLMRVKKGDVIALSGNTGGSGGPHLHYEIRETKSEYPVNPLLCGFNIKDNIKPEIRSIILKPLDDTSYVNNKNIAQRFLVVGSNGNYQLKYGTKIEAYGQIGIGIETIDKLNGYGNRNGIYTIELKKDNKIIYKSEMVKFSFDNSRALNSLIDYEFYLKEKVRFQRSYIEPNNPLGIYKESENNGIVHFKQNSSFSFKYTVNDSYKNQSTLSFKATGNIDKKNLPSVVKQKFDTSFSYKDSNFFAKQNLQVRIPKDALYNDLNFHYFEADTAWGAITPTYFVHNDYTPLHKPIYVSIKVGRLSEYLRSKATVVHFDRKKRYYAKGGEWRNNFITAKSKAFGGFAVMIDTVPPKITPLNIIPNRNMATYKEIAFKIGDNLSGIKTYKGYIDGKWVIMEYEAKKAKIFYTFDKLPKGKHEFKVEVTDGVGNKTVRTIPFAN